MTITAVILKDGTPAKVLEDRGDELVVEYERLDWKAGYVLTQLVVPRRLTKPLS